MTISAQNTFVQYAGFGSSGPFVIPFPFLDASHIVAEKTLVSGEVQTLTGNVITGAGSPTGGFLTTSATVTAGQTLTIYRNTALTQEADYVSGDAFPAGTHEAALDKLTMIAQERARDTQRVVLLPLGQTSKTLSGLDTATEGDLIVADGQGGVEILPAGDFEGAKGDPGEGAIVIGLFTDIANMTMPAGTTVIRTAGYAAHGDFGGGLLEAVDDTFVLEGDAVDLTGQRWRYLQGQALAPENFGAIVYCEEEFNSETQTWDVSNWDDATDTNGHWRALCDLITHWGGGVISLRPGARYGLGHTDINPNGGFPTKTVTRKDGRTISGGFISKTVQDGFKAMGWDGFVVAFNGAKIICNGRFNLTAADYTVAGSSGLRKITTRIPLEFYKCRNGRVTDHRLDGEWRFQTTDTGVSTEDWAYGIRITGCFNVRFEGGEVHDFAEDCCVIAHRNIGTINGITAATTEGYPEPDRSTESVYEPAGLAGNLQFIGGIYGPARRQGFSPVGVINALWDGCTVKNIGRYIGTAPRWQVGDVQDGSVQWQFRGFPPRLAWDFEPVRSTGYQVDLVLIRNCVVYGCIGGWIGAPGDWGIQRVEQSLAASAVDVTTNTFTKTSLTLPRALADLPAQRIRCWSDGALPGGLAEKTDYYLIRTGSTTFQLARTYADAVAGLPIDITDQGSGNHFFCVYDALPNVYRIWVESCDFEHPSDGTLAPMQAFCDLTVRNSRLTVLAGNAVIGPTFVYRERTRYEGNDIVAVRQLMDVDSYNTGPTTASSVDTSADTITLPSGTVVDGMGKYEFVPLKFSTGQGYPQTLPAPLQRHEVYYGTRQSAGVFKLSYSLTDAINGVYIDLTTAGSGSIKCWRFQGSKFYIVRNSMEHRPRLLEFDAAVDVSPTDNAIVIAFDQPNPEVGRWTAVGGAYGSSETFRLEGITTGATAPTGLATGVNYFAYQDPNIPNRVFLAATSADATNHVPIDITAIGSGRFRLAQTNLLKAVDLLDSDCDFHDNDIFLSRRWRQPGASTQTVVNIEGITACGGNTYNSDLTAHDGCTFNITYASVEKTIRPDSYRRSFFASAATTQVNGVARFSLGGKSISLSSPSTPAAINDATLSTQTFTITGLKAGDLVTVHPPSFVAGLFVRGAVCSADDSLAITWENFSGLTLTPPTSGWGLSVTRMY